MFKHISLLISIAILLFITTTFSFAAGSGVVQLPQTGQTKCYDSAGVEIACAGTGQDGEIRAGVPWPNPRFKVGTGTEADCITDNLTGLMWPKNGNFAGSTKKWDDAIDYANNLTFCGYSDWRLPNVNELESLANTDMSDSATWLNGQGFTNVQSDYYWSSTTGVDYYLAWAVRWTEYDVVKRNNKYYDYYIWPVRSVQLGSSIEYSKIWKTGQIISYRPGDDGDLEMGASWPNMRFSDYGDGTVTDNLTGLVWLKNANCIKTNYPGFDSYFQYSDGWVTWQDALDFIKGVNNGTYSQCGVGYRDWRLPNRKELRSLIDYSIYNPALPAGHPFTYVESIYLSSTTDTFYTGSAWGVSMFSGHVDGYTKDSYGGYVWLVRSGQVGSFGDSDNDGYTSDVDCDDYNASINSGASDNNCNGIDENCSGVTDEGYVPTITSCGIGECASTGQLICQYGLSVDTCVFGQSQTEGSIGNLTCSDSKDNDCDGYTDVSDLDCNNQNNSLPDLVVISVGFTPSKVIRGSSITVTDTIKNRGKGPAGESTTNYYLSKDNIKSKKDTLLTDSSSVQVLDAAASSPRTTAVTIPANTKPGKYYVIACADDTKQVTESKEKNNCKVSKKRTKVRT